jgi:hypothetical protein
MRAWVLWTEPRVKQLLRPTDAPHAAVSGENPDRILIFGAGPAVGWGVLSHDLALPGSLARELAQHTGRGVEVDVVSDRWVMANSALEELESLRLSSYDAIVIMLGVDDSRNLVPLKSWRLDLTAIFNLVEVASSPGTPVFIVGIHPIRSIPVFDCLLGGIADRHAARMNAATAEIAATRERITFVPWAAAPCPPENRFRDAPTYKRWAQTLTEQAAPRLGQSRNGRRPPAPVQPAGQPPTMRPLGWHR